MSINALAVPRAIARLRRTILAPAPAADLQLLIADRERLQQEALEAASDRARAAGYVDWIRACETYRAAREAHDAEVRRAVAGDRAAASRAAFNRELDAAGRALFAAVLAPPTPDNKKPRPKR